MTLSLELFKSITWGGADCLKMFNFSQNSPFEIRNDCHLFQSKIKSQLMVKINTQRGSEISLKKKLQERFKTSQRFSWSLVLTCLWAFCMPPVLATLQTVEDTLVSSIIICDPFLLLLLPISIFSLPRQAFPNRPVSFH